MDIINCSCKCNTITFDLVNQDVPIEIARCYCSICKSLNKSEFLSFCKYNKTVLNDINFKNITIYRSSNRAIRELCSNCNSPIYMLYDDSPNV